MPEAFDCAYEERAAIIQYDAGYTRKEAEQRACKRTERYMKRDGTIDFKHTLVMPKQPPKPAAKVEERHEEQMSFEEFRQQARSRFGYE